MLIAVAGKARAGKDATATLVAKWFGKELVQRIAFAEPIKAACRDWYDFSKEQLHGKLKDEPDARYPRVHDGHDWQQSPTNSSQFMCANCGTWLSASRKVSDVPADCASCLTPREAYRFVRTEVGRSLWSNTWAALGVRKALWWTDYDKWADRKGLHIPTFKWPLGERGMEVPPEFFKGYGKGDLFRHPDFPGDLLLITAQGNTALAEEAWVDFKLAPTRLAVFTDLRFPNECDLVQEVGGEIWYVDRAQAGLQGSTAAHESEAHFDYIRARADVVIDNNGTLRDLDSTVADLLHTLKG